MRHKSNRTNPARRPAYALRPVSARNRAPRCADPEIVLRAGNAARAPYPARGRRRWLDELARVRYRASNLGWKSWKR